MFEKSKKITVGKLEAARRQLKTAIELWFNEGDPVSTHTLAFAAYEVIHVISKKRNRKTPLIFDSAIVKDEDRGEWNKTMKKEASFFKHANNDADATIDFLLSSPPLFILFAVMGIQLAGETLNDAETAFFYWLCFHEPELLTDEGRKLFQDGVDPQHLANVRNLGKREFFQIFSGAPPRPRGGGGFTLSVRP